MTQQDTRQLTDLAAGLFEQARKPVALTGAGFSTRSGIPDFRSARSGLWTQVDPMEVASLFAFRRRPQRFYEWFHKLASTLLAAEPNSAHTALAELEQGGFLAGVVTQNVDGLHQRAGSVNVCELHGHVRQATCIDCFNREPAAGHLKSYVATGEPPRCSSCGGYLKPDVILFGEQLPFEEVAAARELLNSADLVLVGGSSLEVAPVARFPYQALEAGAHLIIINIDPTYLDDRADVVIHSDVADIMPEIAHQVLHG